MAAHVAEQIWVWAVSGDQGMSGDGHLLKNQEPGTKNREVENAVGVEAFARNRPDRVC